MEVGEEIIRRWKKGERDAFDTVYEAYKNLARRTAYLICKNQADSEDIVQETFVKCHLHIRELKKEKEFKAWMLKILVRCSWQFLKKKNRELPDDESVVRFQDQEIPGLLDIELKKEREREIFSSIQKLSDKHRIVIILYYYDEMSVKEIAKILGCMEGTVKSRLYTARNQLKTILEGEDLYD